MSLLRKTILVMIFALLFYILFRLVKKRTNILNVINQNKPITEGLSCASEIKDSVVKVIYDSNNVKQITDSVYSKGYYTQNSQSLKLKDFHIKASYHSAYNGKEISKDMILYLLFRGYRFFDFEVSYGIISSETSNTSKYAVVSYNGSNTVSLQDLLEIINTNAFSNVPNKDDPLFIQIRPIYGTLITTTPLTDDDSKKNTNTIADNNGLNTKIKTALTVVSKYKHSGLLNNQSNTLFSSLKQKAIIVMKTTTSTNGVYTINNDLNDLINIDPYNMKICNAEGDLTTCRSAQQIILVRPTDANEQVLTQNPQALTVISKTGCHICPMMAWMSSYIGGFSSAGLSQLGEYENMFLNAGGSAFILLSEAKSYATMNDPSKLNDTKLSV